MERKYTEMIERIEALRRERDEAIGARKELLKQLKEEFGIESVKQARKKLQQLERIRSKLEQRVEKEYQKLSRHPAFRDDCDD